mgnify:CR=1 FL=1
MNYTKLHEFMRIKRIYTKHLDGDEPHETIR